MFFPLGPNGRYSFSQARESLPEPGSVRNILKILPVPNRANLHLLSLVSALAIGCAWVWLHPRLRSPQGQLLQSSSMFFPALPAMAVTYLPFPALWPQCSDHRVLRYLLLWCIWHSCAPPHVRLVGYHLLVCPDVEVPENFGSDYSQPSFLEVSTILLADVGRIIYRLLCERY